MFPTDIQFVFEQGMAAHRRGDLELAEKHYAAVLKGDPEHAQAGFMLGTVCLQKGELSRAEGLLRHAARLQPHNPEISNNLGLALMRRGNIAEAATVFENAMRLRPQYAGAMMNYANALRLSHRAHEAIAAYTAALSIAPDKANAYYNRGALLDDVGEHELAANDFRHAIQLQKDFPEAHNNLGKSLWALSRPDEALAEFEKALALKPDFPEALVNMGAVYFDLGQAEKAIPYYASAISMAPDLAEAYNNRGNAYRDIGLVAEALADYRHVIAIAPQNREAQWNIALTQLLTGNWDEGWPGYELRLFQKKIARPLDAVPEWNGEPLKGRSILVYCEQGLGDTIQFIRFVPGLAKMGANVTVLAPRHLHRILSSLNLTLSADVPADRKFDYQKALMSLAGALHVTIDQLPVASSYLLPERARVDRWREKIGTHGFKTGICWQGNPRAATDRGRSIPLAAFAPLAEIPGVRLISLQKGDGLDQLQKLKEVVERFAPFDDDGDAFTDTAAIIQNLDLVITSDTAVAHLAGALGKTTWIVLKHVPDWRWLLNCTDTPWYPNARLFRQAQPGDWNEAMARVAADLRVLSTS